MYYLEPDDQHRWWFDWVEKERKKFIISKLIVTKFDYYIITWNHDQLGSDSFVLLAGHGDTSDVHCHFGNLRGLHTVKDEINILQKKKSAVSSLAQPR